MKVYEHAKIQCHAIKKDGKRCQRIAAYSNGNKALCHEHNQIAIRDKANTKPLEVKRETDG